ncbi:MAG: ABC transporter ATP-binding protein [Erysipelotrichales bacterium]|nr:ABC transporter ATP-binding protein [Erysipelotrichales bacterium]
MIKLLKYLKPFILPIIIVIGLLYVQAQTDLALPDYMSNIITDGIQYSGIEDAVFEEVSEETYRHVYLFIDEEHKQFVNDSYRLENGKYYLNELSQEERAELSAILTKPIIIVYFIDQTTSSESTLPKSEEANALLATIPPGMSLFDLIEMQGEEAIKNFTKQADTMLTEMNDSNLEGYAKTFIKQEYLAIGKSIEELQLRTLLKTGLRMLGVALIGAICAILVSFCSSRIGTGFARNLRETVFTKIESFSNAEFNKFSTASLITRTTNDVQQVQMIVVMVLRMLVYAPIIGVGALLKVTNTNMAMTAIIGGVIVVILIIISVTMVVALPKFKIAQELVDKLNLAMRETLSGMLVIRAFHNEDNQEAKFDKANKDITNVNLFTGRLMSVLMPLMTLVMNSVTILIIWVGSKQVDLGNLDVGSMMAFLQYAMQIIMSFLMISMMSIILPRSLVAAGRIAEVLETDVAIKDPTNPKSFKEDMRGVVEFKNVSFRYPGAEEDVLHDISFKALPNQTTAFIGSTGSGKSTVVNLIPRFFDVTEGAIEVDGVDIREVTQHALRDKIGYVPQKGVLFTGDIASNLRYGKNDASLDDLQEAARVAQAEEFISSKPEGYETHIAQGGTNVSGGQKQRLSIARALVKKPEIYIFDDSFSALDFKTDAALRKALGEVTAKTQSTVLIVAQRISSIMHADQICVLDNGRIVGIGTHEELMNNCSVYQEIALSQLSKEELAHE